MPVSSPTRFSTRRQPPTGEQLNVGPLLASFWRTGLMALAPLAALGEGALAAEPVVDPVIAQTTPDQEMDREIDRVRTAHGLRQLRRSQALRNASRRYARRLVLDGRFAHGVNLRSRGFGAVGEVLERHRDGGRHVQRTVRAWMRSPSHRKVLLNPRYEVSGAGLAHGESVSIWVLRVGQRGPSRSPARDRVIGSRR